MAKEKFDIIQSTCIPIQIDNCNTDLIIPARYLASTTRDPKFFGDAFMHDLRFDAEGNPVADFVMNQPEYAEAPRKGVHEIIVGGQNWGSGSSREHAAWAIAGYGVRVVISSSFADIHRNNLLNCFVLPVIVSKEFQQELFDSIAANPQTEVKVDVPNQTVTNLATGHSEHFDINSYKKYCLMNAYDDIDFLLSNKEKIETYEQQKDTASEETSTDEPVVEESDFQTPPPAPLFVEAKDEAPESEPAEEVAPVEVATHYESEPCPPQVKLPTDHSLTKWICYGLLTLGIYNLVIGSKISGEINVVAKKYDGRNTSDFFLVFILTLLLGGIPAIVWNHCISDRINNELKRRGIPYSFGPVDYWLWSFCLGFLIIPTFIYIYKFLHAMNLLNADYNQKG